MLFLVNLLKNIFGKEIGYAALGILVYSKCDKILTKTQHILESQQREIIAASNKVETFKNDFDYYISKKNENNEN